MKQYAYEFNLAFMVRMFRRYWRAIIFAALLGGLSAGVYCKYLLQASFRSSITIYFGKVITPALNTERLLQIDQGKELALGMQMISDYRELINSDFFRENVIKRMGWDGIRKKCDYQVDVKWLTQTRIMRIDIESACPIQAQKLAAAYAMVFVHDLRDIVGVQNAQVISESIAVNQNSPMRMIWYMMGGFFWFGFLWWVLCCFKRFFNRSVPDVETWRRISSIPVLGEISELPKGLNRQIFTEEKMHPCQTEFRRLLVNFINRTETLGKTVLFVSPEPDDQKTRIVTILLGMTAETGRRTLLIDGRGVSNGNLSSGLRMVLNKDCALSSAVKKHEEWSRLDVLSGGSEWMEVNNLLLSPGFGDFIQQCRENYEVIGFDVPDCDDAVTAMSMARYSDWSVELVARNKTSRKSIEHIEILLEQNKCVVGGIVLDRA